MSVPILLNVGGKVEHGGVGVGGGDAFATGAPVIKKDIVTITADCRPIRRLK